MSSIESNIEYDLSTDDSDDDALNLPGLASSGIPGLIVNVEFDDNLSDPIIDNGKVRMPRGGSGGGWLPRPVEFGSGVTSPISGVLQGMSFATGIGEIYAKNGEVYFPLAVYNVYYGGSYSESNVAGAIAGVKYSTSLNKPQIDNGVIELPEVGIAAASFSGGSTTSVNPGGLKGAEFRMDVSHIEASDGLLRFPLAATVDYSFVPTSTAVAGAIAGIRYAPRVDDPESGGTSINQPRILPGGLIELPPENSESLVQGVIDNKGYFHAWEDVQNYVGAQIPVASIALSIDGTHSIPLSLAVGFNGRGLTFYLIEGLL